MSYLDKPQIKGVGAEKGNRQRFPRNDFCSTCSLNCPYSLRIAEFRAWLSDCKHQILVIEYQDEDDEIHRKIVPKHIRFSNYYIKRLRKRFFSLIPYFIKNYEVMFFITLTVSPTWNLPNLFIQVPKHFHHVIDVLKKRLKRQGIDLDYIKVYEPTEEGIIHIHIVLFLTGFPTKDGKIWLIDKGELDNLWGLGHTWLGWEDKYGKMIWLPLKKNGTRNVKKALNYILKYLSKAHENHLFASLIWSKGRGGGLRCWTTSRSLSLLLKDNTNLPKTAVVVWFGYV